MSHQCGSRVKDGSEIGAVRHIEQCNAAHKGRPCSSCALRWRGHRHGDQRDRDRTLSAPSGQFPDGVTRGFHPSDIGMRQRVARPLAGGERQRIGGRETSGGGVSPGHSWARQNSRVAPTTRCRQKRYAYVPEVTVHISVTWFSFSPWDSDRSQVAERLRADMQAFAAAGLSFAGVRAYLGRLGAATRSAHAIMTRIPRSCPVGGIRCHRIYSSRGAGLSEVSAPCYAP